MRTIEEITKDLSENNGMLLIQSVLTKEDKIRCLLKKIDLGNELIAAQDAEIARLRQQLEWQPIETAPRDGKPIHESDELCSANARLITAASRMYELLAEARKIVRDMPPDWNYKWDTLAMAIKNLMDEIDGQEEKHV